MRIEGDELARTFLEQLERYFSEQLPDFEVARTWFDLALLVSRQEDAELRSLIGAGFSIFECLVPDLNDLKAGYWMDDIVNDRSLTTSMSRAEGDRQLRILHRLLHRYVHRGPDATTPGDRDIPNRVGSTQPPIVVRTSLWRRLRFTISPFHSMVRKHVYNWSRFVALSSAAPSTGVEHFETHLQALLKQHNVSTHVGHVHGGSCVHILIPSLHIDVIVDGNLTLRTILPVTLAQMHQVRSTGDLLVPHDAVTDGVRRLSEAMFEPEYVDLVSKCVGGVVAMDTFCREWVRLIVQDDHPHSQLFNRFMCKVTDVVDAVVTDDAELEAITELWMLRYEFVNAISADEAARRLEVILEAFIPLFEMRAK